jgi:protein OS-9
MTSHEGKRYKCFLPVEETKTLKSMLPQNATNVIVESEGELSQRSQMRYLRFSRISACVSTG